MAKHHVMHHVFDAVCIEGFIQSKETAEMAYSNNEMENSSESQSFHCLLFNINISSSDNIVLRS